MKLPSRISPIIFIGCLTSTSKNLVFATTGIRGSRGQLANYHHGKTRYIVKFKKHSKEFRVRLDAAEANEADNGNRHIRNLGTFTVPSNLEQISFKASLINFLPKQDAEIAYMDAAEVPMLEMNDDVEYIEKDSKVYLMQAKEGEITPYGITQVHALDVDDSQVSNRKVCVIDSGYDLGHPDLQTMNINGTDLHPNPGYNGSTAWSEDQSGHGTHVAGTIAAIGNNNIGVQGVVRNGQMNLHIIRAFGSDGLGAWKSRMIIAVQACVDSKSNVVSMSWSGQYPSQLEEDAFEDWVNNDDVLFVAAAGNSNNTEYAYPASYDSVLSVAAVDESGDIASFSTSNDQVDIAAPGVAVLSTVPRALGQEYGSASGTSMACPHVAGVAALIWSHHPEKSAREVWEAMVYSAKDKGSPDRDDHYGFGIVQADAAEECLDTRSCKPASSQPSVSAAPSSSSAPTGSPTTSPTVNSVLVSCGKDQTQVAVEIYTGDSPYTISFELLNSCSNEIIAKGDFTEGQENILFLWENCVDIDNRYKFVIRDDLSASYYDRPELPFYTLKFDRRVVTSEDTDWFGSGIVTYFGADSCCGKGEKLLEVGINTDFFPYETSWSILNSCTDELVVGGNFANYNETYYESAFEYCLDEKDRYKFVIRDSWGNGIYNLPGKDNYNLVYDGEEVARTDSFSGSAIAAYFGADSCCGKGKKLLELEINTDFYSKETSWSLFNTCKNDRVIDGNFTNDDLYYEFVFEYCLDEMDRYKFVIRDSWGDGIYSFRKDDYRVVYDGEEVARTDSFDNDFEETESFGTFEECKTSNSTKSWEKRSKSTKNAKKR